MREREIHGCPILIPDGVSAEQPLVMVIGGSSGGLRSLDQGQFYASHGYPAAVIPYFGIDGHPAELKLIALEHFRDCIAAIGDLPEFRGRPVFIQGTSKGAEAALLLCARRIVDVDGAILISPSRYVWGAAEDLEALHRGAAKEASCWSWGGEPVAFVPFDPGSPTLPEYVTVAGAQYLVFKDTWYPRLSGNTGLIDLQDLTTPLLLFSGEDDLLWPSTRAAREIEASLQDLGKAELVRHVSFPGVGHQIPFPGKNPVLQIAHPQLGYAIAYGGDEHRTRAAAETWWLETRRFLQTKRQA